MKIFYILCLLALSLGASSQVVTADPAAGAMNITDNITNLDRSRTVATTPVKLTVPVLNLSPYNAIPTGSTTLIIGLGTKLALSPSFNVATARLSNYFSFVYNTSASQPRIIGTQIAAIPKDFTDTTSFQLVGTGSGSSAASVNFSINPGGNVDDEDGSNNSSSISYTVLITLPVTMSSFEVGKTGCNFNVAFTTAEERNVNNYEVEASKDGSSFISLADIPATNAGRYNKTFLITESLKTASLFVRIKTVDKDARITYSEVRKISGECEGQRGFVLGLYPNPVLTTGPLTIVSKEGSFNGRFNVSLIDVNGRLLQMKQLQLANTSSFSFNPGNISSGHYLIKVVSATGAESATIHFQKN